MAGCITLLTDFGLQDVYVGVMKGVVLQINPTASLIDLTHQIPPQDILAARFQLLNAYPYFPDGTVHLVVVDPGVGSSRRAIALQTQRGFLVAPDNGVLSGVIADYATELIAAVELDNSCYWRTSQPSHTFHGRDIFAPAAAYLSQGIALENLGTAIALDSLQLRSLPNYQQTETGYQGVIQAIDQFGNLITNLPGKLVESTRSWTVIVGDRTLAGQSTYAAVEPGEFVALVGSHGWLEIAVNGGSAASDLNRSVGDSVSMLLT